MLGVTQCGVRTSADSELRTPNTELRTSEPGSTPNSALRTKRLKGEAGQELVEYALLLGLIVMASIGVLELFGGSVRGVFERAVTFIEGLSRSIQ